ncbi:MAG: amidohydrolase family protein [Alphaproteobacteria bacterium]
MRLDAHQHFWDYAANPHEFPWMTDTYASLRRNFLPQDLAPLLDAAGYDGTIAVQARELTRETDFLLDLARRHKIIKGVVGWIDLCAADVDATLERYADESLLKGFRMLIHNHPDPDFADSDPHTRGVARLATHGWTYDLLVRSPHLPASMRLVDQLPNQLFVIDHIAKPVNDRSDWDAWRKGMATLAARENVCCKLSGLVTEGDWQRWTSADFEPFLDEVLDAFGSDRCMIGSDWPVCTSAADYGSAMAVVEDWSGKLNPTERAAILGGNCARFYGVEVGDDG